MAGRSRSVEDGAEVEGVLSSGGRWKEEGGKRNEGGGERQTLQEIQRLDGKSTLKEAWTRSMGEEEEDEAGGWVERWNVGVGAHGDN